MLKYKTYVYKLYPNKKQREMIEKNIEFSRYVYNKYLEIKIKKYNKYKDYIRNCLIRNEKVDKSIIDEINRMPPLSEFKSKHTFLKEADSIALDTARSNVKNAFMNFYKHITNFPKFKKKYKVRTYTTRYINDNIKFEKNKIRLPKIGFVKSKVYREIPSNVDINNVTIKADRIGNYYISVTFSYNISLEEIKFSDIKATGIDFNIEKIVVTNDGYMPGKSKNESIIQARIDKEAKKLGRLSVHSNKWYRQLYKMRKLYNLQRNIRKDNLHNISNKILSKYNLVAREDISIKEMAKEVASRRALYSAAYYKLCGILKGKLEDTGSELVKVDKYFKSSQICNNCGNINKELKLEDRIYKCEKCGYVEDRDINAAKNISREGIKNYYVKQI